MRWFISDPHFGHAKVIEYSGRPFKSVEEMDNVMIAKWNNVVGDDDDVFVLGDFGLSSVDYLTDVLHSLKGNKVLIRGNHDGSVSKMRRVGFDAVVEEAIINIGGMRTQLVHYPYGTFTNDYEVVLHGHIHEKGLPYFENGQMCMCVELWDYAPVSEKTVNKLIQKWIKHGNSSTGSSRRRSGEADAGGNEI